MRAILAVLCITVAGCTFQVGGLSLADGGGGGPDLGDGSTGPDFTGGCSATGSDDHCSADGLSLLTCKPDGSGFTATPCAFACAGGIGMAHCSTLAPSGPAQKSDYQASGLKPLGISADTTFDTTTGAITQGPTLIRAAGSGVISGIGFRSANQTGGPNASVWAVDGFTVAPSVRVTFAGGNAAVIVSAADVTVGGTIDASGSCTFDVPGPGGAQGSGIAAGPQPGGGGLGASGGAWAGGGGGGGFGDTGGAGSGSSNALGGSAGAIFGDLTVQTFVLEGGAAGGAGGDLGGGMGGSGGGAVQLSAAGAITIANGGSILAGGCGGKAGGNNAGGGGGGAGGAIVLEAARVTFQLNSTLAANGGGGGGADGGNDGSDGVAGGAGGTAGNNGQKGGAGGKAGNTRGGTPAATNNQHQMGGGGGGAAGRIAIKTLNGMSLMDMGGNLSPASTDKNSQNQNPTTIGAATFN